MRSYIVVGAFAATALAGPLAVADEPVLVARAPASASSGGTVVSATSVATSTSAGPVTSSNPQAPNPVTTKSTTLNKRTTSRKTTTKKKTTTKRKTTTKKQAKSKQKAIPAGPTAATYKSAVVNHHNYHRANHSAPNIEWSPKMASIARAIAQTCVYAHNVQMGGGGYGQNIAAGAPASDVSGVITNMFYNNELPLYPQYGTNNPDMSNFESWGHFSQVVWKDTKQVGCYTYDCSKKKGGLKNISNVYSNIAPVFTVCNYYPPGNYQGEYTNVGKPTGLETVDGNFRVNEQKIVSPNPPPLSYYTKKSNKK